MKEKKNYQYNLNHKIQEIATEGETSNWEQLMTTIGEASKMSTIPTKNKNKHSIPENIRELIKKRDSLKKEQKNTRNKIEFNLVCKLIKKLLRKQNQDKMNALITQVMETTKKH